MNRCAYFLTLWVWLILTSYLLVATGDLKAAPYALQFNNVVCFGGPDAGGDYVRIPDSPSLRDFAQITLECWINPSPPECLGAEVIVGKGDHQGSVQHHCFLWYGGVQEQPGNVGFELASDSGRIAIWASIGPYNAWHHVAGVYDGSRMSIFVDGVLSQSVDSSLGIVCQNQDPLFLNHHTWWNHSESSTRIRGSMDEVRISRVARYLSPFPTPTRRFCNDSLTAALYHFDEGTGSTVYDASSNGNNGSLVGNPVWITSPVAPDAGCEPPRCLPTPLPFIDNFDSPTLDSCWYWVREDASHWSLTERPAWMRVWTQGGEIHVLDARNLLLRAVSTDSFSIVGKISINPQQNYQCCGLLIYLDDTNFMKVVRLVENGHQYIVARSWDNNACALNQFSACSDTSLFLRLTLQNGVCSAYWSVDSVNWQFAGYDAWSSWLHSNQLSVGLNAENECQAGYSAASIPADFDYFCFEPQRRLILSPDSLIFGLIDFGNDSTRMLAISNFGGEEILIQSLTWTLPNAFNVDTSQLNRHVAAQSTIQLPVHFAPTTVGAYHGRLQIIADQTGNDTIRIPLYGEAQAILPPVDSLVITKGQLNGVQLHWSPVLHTISGQPVPPTVGYIIYGAETPDGPWFPFGYSTTTSYLHPYVLRYRRVLFYSVTADPTVAETFKAKRAVLPEFFRDR
jgi:regulation of enolase protein 1 (concanavalin A-like superfamily)